MDRTTPSKHPNQSTDPYVTPQSQTSQRAVPKGEHVACKCTLRSLDRSPFDVPDLCSFCILDFTNVFLKSSLGAIDDRVPTKPKFCIQIPEDGNPIYFFIGLKLELFDGRTWWPATIVDLAPGSVKISFLEGYDDSDQWMDSNNRRLRVMDRASHDQFVASLVSHQGDGSNDSRALLPARRIGKRPRGNSETFLQNCLFLRISRLLID